MLKNITKFTISSLMFFAIQFPIYASVYDFEAGVTGIGTTTITSTVDGVTITLTSNNDTWLTGDNGNQAGTSVNVVAIDQSAGATQVSVSFSSPVTLSGMQTTDLFWTINSLTFTPTDGSGNNIFTDNNGGSSWGNNVNGHNISFASWSLPTTSFNITADTSQASNIMALVLDTIVFVEAPTNTPPTIANFNGDSFTYSEGDSAEVIDQGTALTIADSDSSDFDTGNITVTITSGEDAAEDILSIDTSGVVSLQGSTAGSNVSISGTVVGTLANNIAAGNDFVINLNSAATAARVMGLSRALTYFNSDNDNPTTGARNLRMTVDDGDGGVSINSDITATVVRVNDNPIINNLAGDTLNYDEDDGKQNIDISANASVTDVDSTNFNTGSLTVTIPTNKDASEDILGFENSITTAGTAGATVSVGGTNIGTLSNSIAEGNDLVVSFNSASTPALIQALVRAITYENSDNLAPTESTRTIRLLLLDGDGGSSGNIDTSVTVSAINDLPVGTNQVLTPNEGQALSITTANFGYSDPEGDTLNLVTIVAAPASGDLWLDTDGNGSINGAESALMNNATISKANLDAGQLKYFANGSASSSFSFNVNDGTNDAAGNNTITLSVNPQPTVTINQASGQADPTNSASVLFDVVFSESVTGFVSSDISLSGDVTATVTNLAGSGTTYIATATISAGQGDIVATVASDVATASSGALNKASTSTDNTVEFDNVAPSAPTALDLLASSDTGTSDSDNITNDTSPTVSGSGESDATITLFSDLDGNNSLNGVEPSITANVTANSWSATLAGLSSSDPNTLHNLKAFQTDPAGNISAVSSALAMTLDNTLPTGHTAAISTSPINSSNENALAFTLNSTEVGAAYSYTISSSGGGTAVTNLGTISSTTESFNNIDVAGLADGTLTVSVLLTDIAGNIASAVTDTVEKDTQLPSGHSVTIDQSPIVAANANAVSFTFNAAEITATYQYSFSSSNGGTPVTGTGSISQTNQQISAIDLSALADGQISLSATLTDAAGNQALAVTDTVSKDALGPVVTDVSLNTGALGVSDTVIATITFDDLVQLSDLTPTVALDIGGASRTASYASGNNSTQLVFHYDVVAGDNDSDGVTAQSITTNTATMTDANGNAAILSFTAFMEPSLIVDTTAPNAAAPTSTAQTLNADTITLSQSNYAENGITIVALADANQDGNADNSTALATDVVSAGNWSLTLPLTQDASNYFVLRAQDNAGNSSDIAVGDYLEDSTAPAVPVVSSPITTTYTQNIVLDITGTHSENGITVGLYADSDNNGIADNSSVIASDIVSGNSFSITTNLTDNSNNDFVILANDSAGNNSTAVALVTIVHDNTAPTATVDILTTSLNNPPISGTLADAGGLASLTYTLSDGSNNFGPYTPDTISDINSGNWKDNATDDSLADGSYDIELSLTDLAGNTATVNETDVLNIDSTSPQGYSVAIEQSRIDANNETALSFIISDGELGNQYDYSISDGSISVSGSGTISSTSETVTNVDVSSLAEGTLTLSLSLTDTANNTGELATDSVEKVYNSAPVISGTPATSVFVGQEYVFVPQVSDIDGNDTLHFSINNLPTWLSLDTATGRISGTPAATDVGTSLPISLTVSDGELSATLASFNIEVIAVNRAPTTNNYGLTLEEDSSLAITPRATDEDGDPLSYRLVTPPQHGELQSNGQVWLYQPEADYNGQDSFEFTASDGEFESQVATVTLTISAVNDAPIAIVDNLSFSQNEANQYNLNVLSNDYDVDGDELSIVNASVDVGTVTIEDNQLVYQAIAGIQGSINIQYMISDGSKQTAQTIATFSLGDADNSNLPTLTLPDDIEVDSQRLFTRIDVGFATAVDSSGNPIAVKQLNKRLYFPPGHHQVYWQAEDSQGNVVTAAQSVKVNPIISLGKNAFSAENTRYTARVFLNGLAPEYPLTIPYTVSGSSDAGDHNLVHGELVISSGQTGEIMVDVFADGEQEIDETLVITLDESLNLGGQSSFTLTITENNIAPDVQLLVSQNGQQRHKIVASDELVTIDATVFDSNTEDSHHLAWQSDADALSNQATEANQFVFSSADLAEGVYKISVTVTDDADESLSTTASVYLELVAELPPLGMADSDNDLVPDQLEGYQDSDADGIADYLDHIADCNVLQQDLSLGNYFLKETDPGLCIRKGQYTASNQSGGSLLNQAEVSNRIDQDEQAKNVGGIFDFIIYGLPIAGQSAHVVIPQQQPLPSTAVYRKYFTNAGWGDFITDSNNLVHSAAGEPGYCPPPQHESWTEGLTRGHWCVQLTIEDGGPNDDDGIANGTIVDPSGVAVSNLNNSAPIAVEDTVALLANETVNIDVLANDTDADNDQLSIVNASVDIGLVVIDNGQLIYTAADDYLGQALINYSIDDNNGGSAYATVTVTINSNTPPTANDDEAQTDDRTNIHIDVLNNDVDVENDELTIISADAEMGSVSITSNNHILYQPQSGFEGTDIVHYTISDSAGAQSSAQVTVTVTAYKEVIVESKNSGGQLGGLSLLLLAMFSLWRHRNKLSLILLLLLSPKVIASGWYVDAELGYSSANFDRPHTNVATLLTFDNTDLSWSLGVGYQLSDNWKISARYIDLGSASAQYSLDTLTPDAPGASLDAAAPVLGDGLGIDVQYALWQHEAFSAWLMLGGFYWQYENQLSVIDSNFINQQEDQQLDPYFGLAMSFPITQHWHSGISFKRFALQQNDVDSLYLSVSYYF